MKGILQNPEKPERSSEIFFPAASLFFLLATTPEFRYHRYQHKGGRGETGLFLSFKVPALFIHCLTKGILQTPCSKDC